MSENPQTEETRPRKKAKRGKIIVRRMPWHVGFLSHLGFRPRLGIGNFAKAERHYDIEFDERDAKHLKKWGYTTSKKGKSKKRHPKKGHSKKSSKKQSSEKETSEQEADDAVYLSEENLRLLKDIGTKSSKMSPSSKDQKERKPKTPVPTPPWSVRALSWLAGGHPVRVVYRVKEVPKPKTNDPKTDDPKADDPPEGGSDKPTEEEPEKPAEEA
ncbi:hypothetical protein B0J15DRAFT_462364 [Fusarium solani]|uniref:Uncharacterized protein n=2 Tax=Fusarium solani TaxID=169388 RepID=A0A9P9R7C7_FUSSL|nr:uncharacterized protein B0J15DRAFT_462364 [Fusarium solani]KAH7268344.1 hypothetical protein B0J15DRAFT_462364 [Fusarium solani]